MCKALSKVCCLCYLLHFCHFPESKSNYWKLWTFFPSNDLLGDDHESYQAGMGCLVIFSTFRDWNQSFLLDSAACLSPKPPLLLCDHRQSFPVKPWGGRGSPWLAVPRNHISILSFGSHCLQPTAAAADLCFAAICISNKLIKATN